ncbi:gamma-glutamyltransferase [Flavisphingomonas formosensis]|uniref:gamma-glutamyltransferase n=1 Tax=Flavisphingomonas formosensis TaxID=861534 RepID=UPI0012F9C729|nr:gamma-glutamyltransferase [Sphingomonas formosensis]
MHLADSFSSYVRPALRGRLGAVAAAHPLAVAAGQEMLTRGGSAVDALIAAQAVLCVVAPDACGLGGDMLALVRTPGAGVTAVNGAGAAPAGLSTWSDTGANSITVPGIVDGWQQLASRWGKLPLAALLEPARRIAEGGFVVPPGLAAAALAQRDRLEKGGAGRWALLGLKAGERFFQPELATLLAAIGRNGADAFYAGETAAAIAAAVGALGGALSRDDLAAHRSVVAPPVTIAFRDVRVAVQPPMTQGILLAMALAGREALGEPAGDREDHLAIELTEAAFAYRERAGEGAALLAEPLPIDPERAARRGGPRAYLHTAGVAVSDAEGMVASSLVSVFDDFGSCVFVPACGIVLNNRAGGFTGGANAPGPSRRPVHTLAPAMVLSGGDAIALATPGADGQVQTLLQVIGKVFGGGLDLAAAIAAPRWRSEGGDILIEAAHPMAADLAARGHRLRTLRDGEMRFGAVVCAGTGGEGPFAIADWRRETWAGVA